VLPVLPDAGTAMPGPRSLQFYCLDAVSKMPRSEEEMQTREVRRFIASHPFPDKVQPIIALLKQCQPTDAVKVCRETPSPCPALRCASSLSVRMCAGHACRTVPQRARAHDGAWIPK